MKILLTGIAGFIGFHVARSILSDKPEFQIVGIDNVNSYYDTDLKYGRLRELGLHEEAIIQDKITVSRIYPSLSFLKLDIQNKDAVFNLFETEGFDFVIHLAAQAGVRYSLKQPQAYIDSNVTGFLNILESCRGYPVKHFVYASSSSVYGLNEKTPFSENDRTDNPASLYAATKKMNESMAHVYAHLFGIKSSGLRFFTVYGEWGRPDMAPFIFAGKILAHKPIQVFNYGKMKRDFTYISDIVQGIVNLLDAPPSGKIPCEVYNIGNNSPVELMEFISALENALGEKAIIEFLPMQPGDIFATWAYTDKLSGITGFCPDTSIYDGVGRFAKWYRSYYNA